MLRTKPCHMLLSYTVLAILALSAAYMEDYPFNASKINRPSYQRKLLAARRSGPTMPAKGWEMCCEEGVEVVPNLEHSYVWPMETPERNYFVVSGTHEIFKIVTIKI